MFAVSTKHPKVKKDDMSRSQVSYLFYASTGIKTRLKNILTCLNTSLSYYAL